jgi:hypothetical protein
LLLADLNQVAVFSTARPRALGKPFMLTVVPEARLKVVSDLGYSSDGATLWVVSSDTPRSIQGGFQTGQVTQLRVTAATAPDEGPARVVVHERWDIGDKIAIPELTVARGEPIPAGTAIRAEPSTSAIYLPAYPSQLLTEGPESYRSSSHRSQILRTSLAQQDSVAVARGPWVISSLAVAGESQVMVGLAAIERGRTLKRVLVHGRAWRGGDPGQTVLGDLARSALGGQAPQLGVVRIQP